MKKYFAYMKNIPLRYLSEIVHLSRYVVVILDRHSSDKELSWWLDAINLFLCVIVRLVISIGQNNWLDDKRSSSVCHQVNQNTGLMAKAHFQYIIR